MADSDGARLDQWLWAARIYKTRSLAKAAVEGGKVHVNGARTKPSRAAVVGQQLTITKGPYTQELVILEIAARRQSAPIARTLYEETEDSIEARESLRAKRRMEQAGLTVPRTKPTKRDRRELKRLKDSPS